jgi:hypothetical protein
MISTRKTRRARDNVAPGATDFSMADHLRLIAPALRSTAGAARREVRAAAPAANERPYQSGPPRSKGAVWKIARYCLGDEEVAGIGMSSTHVLLYFYRGVELDEGSGLLEGDGKIMRSIRLRTPAEAARPEVKRMLRKAFQLASKRAPNPRPRRSH